MHDTPGIRAAMRERMDMMLAAARESGLPGSFESWWTGDLYATRASEPDLRFLCNLSVTGAASIEDIRAALADPRWGGIRPTIVFHDAPEPSIDDMLREAGYTGQGWRPMAVRFLDGDVGTDDGTGATGPLQVRQVTDDALEEFVSVLLAGYEAVGVGAQFIEAGHRGPRLQRFAVWSEGRMIATAGMSLQGGRRRAGWRVDGSGGAGPGSAIAVVAPPAPDRAAGGVRLGGRDRRVWLAKREEHGAGRVFDT